MIGVDAHLGKLAGILGNGVQQLPGEVQAVLGAGSDEVHGLIAVNAKIFHQGIGSPDALPYVVLESVTQKEGPLGDGLQSLIGEALHLLLDRCHSGGHVLHAVPIVVPIDLLHDALKAFQFFPGSPCGSCDLSGGALVLGTQFDRVGGCGSHGSAKSLSSSARHLKACGHGLAYPAPSLRRQALRFVKHLGHAWV